VGCIGRYTQCKDAVLKAEVSKFSCLVAAIAIKDQKPLFALTMLSIFMEVLNLFKS
jgi:hypothetical protein